MNNTNAPVTDPGKQKPAEFRPRSEILARSFMWAFLACMALSLVAFAVRDPAGLFIDWVIREAKDIVAWLERMRGARVHVLLYVASSVALAALWTVIVAGILNMQTKRKSR